MSLRRTSLKGGADGRRTDARLKAKARHHKAERAAARKFEANTIDRGLGIMQPPTPRPTTDLIPRPPARHCVTS